MISLHRAGVLKKLINNSRFEEIIEGLSTGNAITSLIAFDISGGLDLVKDNIYLRAFTKSTVGLDTLKILHEKGILEIISIGDDRLKIGEIKNLEHLAPQKLRDYFDNLEEGEEVSVNTLENLIGELMIEKIKF